MQEIGTSVLAALGSLGSVASIIGLILTGLILIRVARQNKRLKHENEELRTCVAQHEAFTRNTLQTIGLLQTQPILRDEIIIDPDQLMQFVQGLLAQHDLRTADYRDVVELVGKGSELEGGPDES